MTTSPSLKPIALRRTKIVATIGPGSSSQDMIGRLLAAGVDVFRLNFSHGAQADHAQVARFIRKQARHQGRYVGILADLQGPKIRIGGFTQGSVALQAGDPFQRLVSAAKKKKYQAQMKRADRFRGQRAYEMRLAAHNDLRKDQWAL